LRYISAGELARLTKHDEDSLIELAKAFGIGGSEWNLEGNRIDPDDPSVEPIGVLTDTYVVSTKDVVFVPTTAGLRSPDNELQFITQLTADIQVNDTLESVRDGTKVTVQTVLIDNNLKMGIVELVR
jgi:hypothetical protein